MSDAGSGLLSDKIFVFQTGGRDHLRGFEQWKICVTPKLVPQCRTSLILTLNNVQTMDPPRFLESVTTGADRTINRFFLDDRILSFL